MRIRKYEETVKHIAELEAENDRIDREIEEAARPAPPKKKPMFTVPILDAPTIRLNAALRHKAEIENTLTRHGAKWAVNHHGDIRHVTLSACSRPLVKVNWLDDV